MIGEKPSWSAFAVTGLVGIVVAAMFLGRSRLISLTIASYAALALLQATALRGWVEGWLPTAGEGLLASAGSILLVTATLYFFVEYALGDVLSEDPGSFITSLFIATALAGMLAAAVFSTVSTSALAELSVLLVRIFTGSVITVCWFLAPIIAIGATRE